MNLTLPMIRLYFKVRTALFCIKSLKKLFQIDELATIKGSLIRLFVYLFENGGRINLKNQSVVRIHNSNLAYPTAPFDSQEKDCGRQGSRLVWIEVKNCSGRQDHRLRFNRKLNLKKRKRPSIVSNNEDFHGNLLHFLNVRVQRCKVKVSVESLHLSL